MRMTNSILMLIVLFLTEASAQCNHGEVRLVDGCLPNEGRVEVCACISMSCSWGTVCDDWWGWKDAQVVCRQLGYRPDGAQALVGAHFGRGYSQQLISLDDVRCNGNEMTLLGCRRNPLFVHDCNHGEDAGVRCAGEFSLFSNCYGIMNVSINNITIISTHGIDLYTIFITWKRQNNSVIIQNQPNSFQIECFSDQHHLGISVNSTTYSVELLGLLPSTSYNCCVSAVYGSYTARAVCTEMVTIQPPTGQPSETPVDNSRVLSSSSVDTIGGVLGFIIAVLLILLALSGAALVYLLRLKYKESSVAADRSSTDHVPTRANMSYTTTLSRSTTSGAHATQQPTRAGNQTATESAVADDYSRIGPSYTYVTTVNNSRRQQPERNRVSTARLSERYEFSETHLMAAGGGGTGDDGAYGVLEGEVGGDIQQHDEYSHLQY